MTSVTLDEVVFDESIYPRAKWSQETVDRYADALEASDHFPAIILEAGTKRLLDGKHRFEAHAQLGRKFIAADLVEIPKGVPAKLFAASLSSKHGDPIKTEDKRATAREIVQANPEYSQVNIASYLGISRQTVGKYVGDIVEHRREVRRARALLLTRGGMSNRKAAEALGVDESVVRADVKADIPPHPEEILREAAKGLPVDASPIVEEILRERAVPAEAPGPAGTSPVEVSVSADAPAAAQDPFSPGFSPADPEEGSASVPIQTVAQPAPDPFAAWSDEERDLLDQLRAGRTVVVSLRSHNSLIAWAAAAGLYERVDRKSAWGNPFVMGEDGSREQVIAAYAEHYLPYKPSLLSRVEGLKGKALGCWCAPEPCHADVLREHAEAGDD